MPANPLIEVFGYPVNDMSPDARRHRTGRLCPFNNSSGPNCTKNSATDPLGVCSIRHGSDLAIVCPVRFRQEHRILGDAADFFFPGKQYLPLMEVGLKDANGKSAGNIDVVLITLDDDKKVVDFGALEIQAVYISGNINKAFRNYMDDPEANFAQEWPSRSYPKPDYLSSSRKRLAPQLIYKGGILRAWNKKMAVAVHTGFFKTMPKLEQVSPEDADIAWLVYDLVPPAHAGRYDLRLNRIEYTKFQSALDTITNPHPGDVEKFVQSLQTRVNKKQTQGLPPQPVVSPSVLPSLEFDDIIEDQYDDIDDTQLESPE